MVDNWWEPELENEPGWIEAYARVKARIARAERMAGWMRRVPVVGSLMWVFWGSLLNEGPYQTIKPRWGVLTFTFLNDGMKPSIWHTWRQVTHDQTDPYTGIYVDGAPTSLKQAQEWELEWELKWKRELKEEMCRDCGLSHVDPAECKHG